MSAMTKSFAEALELDLKSLNSMLNIEGTGGGKVPYHGYVECRLNLPQIEKFDHDVLMLVIDDSQYGALCSYSNRDSSHRYGNRFSY